MKLDFETNISARFHSKTQLDPQQQASLDALNVHVQEIAGRLQTTVRLLITEMLYIKRAQFTKEENHEGSHQANLSSYD